MKSNIKVIFMHGNYGGTAKDNWFPYLQKELTKLGFKVIAQDFPDNELARESYWLPFLKNELHADKNSILIGHSSGAVAALRFAETNSILASVLVGACYTDLGDEQEKKSGYYNRSWDWDAIRKNQQWIIQFASSDDPYIPIAEPRFIHEKLKSEYYEFTNRGHFMGEGNVTFPEIVKAMRSKL